MKNKSTNAAKAQPQKQRDSNIELFRIITMLLIVAHHYVTNSGLTLHDGPLASDPMSGRSLFLLILGAWGKIGINCFVMITGYFMCRSKITAKKFAKLVLEIMLYRIGTYLVFLICGREEASLTRLIKTFLPVSTIEQNFASCFIVFFLFIPFLNALIQSLSERQHVRLLLLCFFTYVLFGTVRGGPFGVVMNYVSWFMVIYFIAAYIRIYPKEWFSDRKKLGLLLLAAFIVSAASVVCCAYAGSRTGMFSPYYFVTDSNSFLAVAVGTLAFMYFRTLKIGYSKTINTIAASTFGVLLLHSNSEAMRTWLWKDTFDITGSFDKRFMPLYAIGCILLVYAVCTLIDILRINLLEKPFFKWWDKHWESFSEKFSKKEDALFKKLHIG